MFSSPFCGFFIIFPALCAVLSLEAFMQKNALARQFGARSLIAFALPNTVMMLFLSLYTIVDGMFISRFVSTTALSAVNMVYPVISVEMALALMLSTGGSAIVARQLGERKEAAARQNFTMLILAELALGLFIALVGNLFALPLIRALGSSAAQMPYCVPYLRISLLFAPCYCLQIAFQSFFVTAGRPGLGLGVTVLAGLTNMVMDYVLIVPADWGIAGAAVATGLGNCIPMTVGLLFFALNRRGTLFFVPPVLRGPILLHSCTNGASEMVTNLANAISTFLFNWQFLLFYGEDGVAAITIVLYFQFVFSAVYFGFSGGISPVVSYKYGCQDRPQLRRIFHISLCAILVCSVFSYVLSRLTIGSALTAFTVPGTHVFVLATAGFPLFAVSFLFMGVSIFSSALFTAFSDGRTSAIISFARTCFFLVAALVLLPALLGEPGLWLAVPAAEALGLAISVFFLIRKRAVYHY